ncbi:MAG: hypothetical protein IJ677_02685 [Alphaproteobacteria bacterium]|nr:hypothetical protein [Alphaproteobacteria bacterium]
MKKVIFTVVAVLVLAGGAGAYWFGNQPKITYYPDGKMKTSVEQKFFKENGEYKIFNQDGTLSQKFNVIDGSRIGQGFIYAGGVTISVNYVNGVLSGPLKLDTKGKVPELDNLQINLSNGQFLLEYKPVEINVKNGDDNPISAPDVKEMGKITCAENIFLDNLQNFLNNQTIDTYKKFAECVLVNELVLDDDLYKCEFKGGYQYPKFTSASELQCESKGLDDIIASSFMNAGIEDIGKVTASLKYLPSEQKFSFIIKDDKGVYNQVQTFKGLEEIISAIAEYTFSKQDSKDTVKMASDIFNNLVISDSQLTIGGKVVSSTKGEFNIMKGFSDPWMTSFFGIENTVTSQMKITDKGMVMNIAYPISKKPLLSAGIQINDNFKQKYKSFLEFVMKEFSENSEDVASENIMAKLPEYSMAFSDVINSINALLMNNKGEKVLGAVFNVKQGVDFMTALEDINNAFTVKIIGYKNNKPNKVISGDMKNGFVANGKSINTEDIYDYLDKDALEEVSKQIEKEYSEVYKMMQENKYPSDPFIKGFYEGYFNAMQQYNSLQVNEKIEQLAANIRKVYVDSDNYGNLDNKLAINLNTVPKDMIASDGSIISSIGGKVNISSAKAFEGDDENLAFTIELDELSQQACFVIATNIWDANSGIMGMGINQNLNDLYLDESEDEKARQCAEEEILCAIEREMQAVEAAKVCKQSGNTIYLKFQ